MADNEFAEFCRHLIHKVSIMDNIKQHQSPKPLSAMLACCHVQKPALLRTGLDYRDVCQIDNKTLTFNDQARAYAVTITFRARALQIAYYLLNHPNTPLLYKCHACLFLAQCLEMTSNISVMKYADAATYLLQAWSTDQRESPWGGDYLKRYENRIIYDAVWEDIRKTKCVLDFRAKQLKESTECGVIKEELEKCFSPDFAAHVLGYDAVNGVKDDVGVGENGFVYGHGNNNINIVHKAEFHDVQTTDDMTIRSLLAN